MWKVIPYSRGLYSLFLFNTHIGREFLNGCLWSWVMDCEPRYHINLYVVKCNRPLVQWMETELRHSGRPTIINKSMECGHRLNRLRTVQIAAKYSDDMDSWTHNRLLNFRRLGKPTRIPAYALTPLSDLLVPGSRSLSPNWRSAIPDTNAFFALLHKQIDYTSTSWIKSIPNNVNDYFSRCERIYEHLNNYGLYFKSGMVQIMFYILLFKTESRELERRYQRLECWEPIIPPYL